MEKGGGQLGPPSETIFKCVFKGKIIKKNLLKIRSTRRVQIYAEVSSSMQN
jgi:hypothetical protein